MQQVVAVVQASFADQEEQSNNLSVGAVEILSHTAIIAEQQVSADLGFRNGMFFDVPPVKAQVHGAEQSSTTRPQLLQLQYNMHSQIKP